MNHNEEVSQIFDSYEKNYTATVNSAIGFSGWNVDYFTKVKANYILELCEKKFKNLGGLRVLDIGCGIGNFHQPLAPRFQLLNGVDISKASIQQARQSNPSVVYDHYDGSILPYPDASFDMAFTVCVMHHVPPQNWSHFTKEMHRVIKPGGMGLVFEHNPLNPLTQRIVNRCPFDEDAVLLKSGETMSLLNAAGFDAMTARFILSVPAGNTFTRSIDKFFSRLPFGAQYYVQADKVEA